MNWLLVFLGGGLGAALRHGANRLALTAFGPGFPWGTLGVNLAGSFVMGLLAGRALAPDSSAARLFLVTGLLGGFTTFSAFSLDAVSLWQRGQPAAAAAYVTASVTVSLLALIAGMALSR